MFWEIVILGIGLASVLEWTQSVIRDIKKSNAVTQLQWWCCVRVPQGIAIAWALHLLGAF